MWIIRWLKVFQNNLTFDFTLVLYRYLRSYFIGQGFLIWYWSTALLTSIVAASQTGDADSYKI